MLIALPNAFGDAVTNMAIDAALLESLPESLAVFRHYGWTEPAATFGYAQAYASVASELASGHQPVEPAQAYSEQISDSDAARTYKGHFTSSHATLVRRLTGGGIVDHRNDWTYALIIHASLPSAQTPATELYERVHRAIAQALTALQIETRLAPCPKTCTTVDPISSKILQSSKSDGGHHASQCFVTPAANDVLRPDGRKIAGAAMKRNRNGLLIQGSIDRGALQEDFDFVTFQAQLLGAISTELDLPTGTLDDIRPLFQSERIEKERQRFAGAEWNRRR